LPVFRRKSTAQKNCHMRNWCFLPRARLLYSQKMWHRHPAGDGMGLMPCRVWNKIGRENRLSIFICYMREISITLKIESFSAARLLAGRLGSRPFQLGLLVRCSWHRVDRFDWKRRLAMQSTTFKGIDLRLRKTYRRS